MRKITVQRFEVSFACVDQLSSAGIEFIQYILQQREITQSQSSELVTGKR
jgi:hypothetical protein